jgi:hypothetical protein
LERVGVRNYTLPTLLKLNFIDAGNRIQFVNITAPSPLERVGVRNYTFPPLLKLNFIDAEK